MRALIRKELRAQLPFFLLIVFLVALNIADVVLGRFPDEKSLSGLLNAHNVESSAANGLVYLLVAMSLALALLPRERDEGTLEFLDALPCTRGRVFAAKALVGMLVLGIYPLLDNLTGIAIHRLGRSSLDPEWPIRLVVTMILIESCVLFSLLGIAMALSYFRRFAFFVLGLLLAAFLALNAAQVPWIHLFDFTEVLRYSFREGQIAVAWETLGVTVGLGLLGYLLAAAVFRLQGDRAARMVSALDQTHLKGPLVALGTIAMVMVWLGVLGFFGYKQSQAEGEDGEEPRVSFRTWQTSQLRAGGYVFLYPANLRSRTDALAARSEEVHRSVREYLGAEPAGEILADLHSELRHVAGTTEWKRINMSIVETTELPEQVAVLGHETVHVYINSLSQNHLSKVFGSSRWWHEGLASFLEFRLFRAPDELARIQRVAAAAHRRKASDFELLVDNAAWAVKHDADLAYPLGEVFFEALTEEHGREAPAAILRALARPEAPEGLAGLDLWRDAFQACGWDLSTTVAAYYRRLQDLADNEQKEFVDSIPKLRGRVLTEADEVIINVIPAGELPEGAQLRCRIRRFADDSDADMYYPWERPARSFRIGRRWVGEGEFWYQLGVYHPDAQFVIYEDWQRARVK